MKCPDNDTVDVKNGGTLDDGRSNYTCSSLSDLTISAFVLGLSQNSKLHFKTVFVF